MAERQRLTKAQRQERILASLKATPTVRISELADAFGVSTETVRRDIDYLSNAGQVDRTYGGAAFRPKGVQPPFGERDQLLVRERVLIARHAASLVSPGEVLMIDSGSSTTQFARALAGLNMRLTVLTNSFGVASALHESDVVRVILCPGDYSGREAAVYGVETVEFLRRFKSNKAFLGAGGLTPEGVMDVNSDASWIKRAMIERADQRFLMVDRKKFDVSLLEVVCPLNALTGVVVDGPPTGRLHDALLGSGVRIHLAAAGAAAVA
jgi:DeoR/GlpR family transcriptional regulator of sugar metabolism